MHLKWNMSYGLSDPPNVLIFFLLLCISCLGSSSETDSPGVVEILLVMCFFRLEEMLMLEEEQYHDGSNCSILQQL